MLDPPAVAESASSTTTDEAGDHDGPKSPAHRELGDNDGYRESDERSEPGNYCRIRQHF